MMKKAKPRYGIVARSSSVVMRIVPRVRGRNMLNYKAKHKF